MEFQSSQANEIFPVSENNNDTKNVRQKSEIQAWLVSYVAGILDIDPDEIDSTMPFDNYGLDSSTAIGLTGDLEDWLGYEVSPVLVYDYPTIETLSQHLASESKE